MPSEITMPQLSDTMTEGTLVKWLKKEGDKVKEGDKIAEVETDKAVMEMETFESGVLAVLLVAEGQKIPVGGRLAVVATGKEDAATVKKAALAGGNVPTAAPVAVAAVEAPEMKPVVAAAAAVAAPVAVAAGSAAIGRVRVSPLAKKVAADKGIDLSQVTGTGHGGRIHQADVLAFVPAAGGKSSGTASSSGLSSPSFKPAATSGEKQVIPLTKMRTVIAQRLQQSKQSIPHFYETIDIDMEAAAGLREKLNQQLEKEKVRLSMGDLIAKAVAKALELNPALNATFNGTEITRYADVNLGMAVALPDGLIVPVLRGINRMGLKEIRQRSADLVDRARGQKLKGDEMSGATFTVSNLGTFGIREFSAIVNPPEVGILAIGSAEQRAVVRNGQIVARSTMTVTLSADHRAIDGAVAAEFLRGLKNLLEEPGLMLV